MVTPLDFKTVACPSYSEVRLSLWPFKRIAKLIELNRPDAIHISTEGPLGYAARRYCVKNNLPFTTAYHTRFPEYFEARTRIPATWTFGVMRWFHKPSSAVLTATRSLRDELAGKGMKKVVRWTRGVDVNHFKPDPFVMRDPANPIFMYVGRVAVEKNIDAFLKLDLPGQKIVVGDGPQLNDLKRKYPKVRFTGAKKGAELARWYAQADVFVFPSLTDTFGLVLLEALACGVPVAAFPVTGPIDVVNDPSVACLDWDLKKAALSALKLDRQDCRDFALKYSWDECAQAFCESLQPIRWSVGDYSAPCASNLPSPVSSTS